MKEPWKCVDFVIENYSIIIYDSSNQKSVDKRKYIVNDKKSKMFGNFLHPVLNIFMENDEIDEKDSMLLIKKQKVRL